MSYSLADLPVEVLEQILLFVPTPRALCRIGTTCSALSRLLTANERVEQNVWGSLYRKRWKCGNIFPQSDTNISYRSYKARHVQDHATFHSLLDVSETVERERDYGLGSKRLGQDPICSTLGNIYYSFDLLRSVANKDPAVALLYPEKNKSVSLVTRCVATMVLDNMHFLELGGKMNCILHGMGDTNSSFAEEGALLLMESQRLWSELLVLDSSPLERMQAVCNKLDELASGLQHLIDTHMGHASPLDVVTLLGTMLVDELGFSVSNVRDNADKSSIERVLGSKTGFPMTMAVICQALLRRVGVPVTIARAHRQVILGLPGNEVFVDVFCGCRLLSPSELRARSDNTWGQTNSVVFKEAEVVGAMIKDLIPCYAPSRHPARTTEIWNFSFRTAILDTLWNGTDIESTRYQYTYPDPAIWKHFNLINDDTFWRHTEAPYYHSEAENS